MLGYYSFSQWNHDRIQVLQLHLSVDVGNIRRNLLLLVLLLLLLCRLIMCWGWLKSVGSQMEYELNHRKPVLYFSPLRIYWETSRCPSRRHRNNSTQPAQHLTSLIPGTPSDRRPGAGDGCRMWFVNSWMPGAVRDLNGNGTSRVENYSFSVNKLHLRGTIIAIITITLE